ncbi:hypothetical protein CEXT_161731 [Caerostris extrusa]|uniref:Uncharacterized protein n=1 Tax=Caerostris extrusa TaxID=172846 RepID=A0AAV4RLI3_CAEEX|nr:hypothetical protein CEXT_161731 [Caerostris extrusa]
MIWEQNTVLYIEIYPYPAYYIKVFLVIENKSQKKIAFRRFKNSRLVLCENSSSNKARNIFLEASSKPVLFMLGEGSLSDTMITYLFKDASNISFMCLKTMKSKSYTPGSK